MTASTPVARPDPYSYFDILHSRVLALMALGYSQTEACQLVAETARPPRA